MNGKVKPLRRKSGVRSTDATERRLPPSENDILETSSPNGMIADGGGTDGSSLLTTLTRKAAISLDWLVSPLLASSGPLSKNRFRSPLVGISCLAIGLPGMWYLSQGYYFMGLPGPIMGLCSFWSDYTCADARHFSLPLRNRAFGLDLLAIYSYLVGLFVMLTWNAGVKQALVNALGMFAGKAIVLEWSGNAANPAQWEVRHTVWHAYVTWLGFACYECIFPEVRNHSLEACALVLIPLRALARTLNLPLGWQLWLGSSSVAAALPHATGWPLPAVWPLPFPTGFKTLVGLACVAGWLLTLVSDAEWSIAASLRRNSLLSRGQITRGGSTSKDAPAVDEKVLGDAVTAPAEEPEEEEGIIVQTPSRKKRSSNRLANLQGGMAAGLAIQGVQTRRSSRLLSPRETPASISSSSRSSSTPVVPKKLR